MVVVFLKKWHCILKHAQSALCSFEASCEMRLRPMLEVGVDGGGGRESNSCADLRCKKVTSCGKGDDAKGIDRSRPGWGLWVWLSSSVGSST